MRCNFPTGGFAEEEKGKWVVYKQIKHIDLTDLEGTIQEAIKYLQNISLPDGFDTIKLQTEPKRYEDGNDLVVFAMRSPTSEEMEMINQEKKSREEDSKDWRRRQYESLKKEFE